MWSGGQNLCSSVIVLKSDVCDESDNSDGSDKSDRYRGPCHRYTDLG